MLAFVLLAVAHTEHWQIYLASLLLGIGVGFAFASMANLIVEAVRPDQTGVATGMNTVMRTIGGAIGGQVAASILAANLLADGLPERSGVHAVVRDHGASRSRPAIVASLAVPGRRPHRVHAVTLGDASALDGAGAMTRVVVGVDGSRGAEAALALRRRGGGPARAAAADRLRLGGRGRRRTSARRSRRPPTASSRPSTTPRRCCAPPSSGSPPDAAVEIEALAIEGQSRQGADRAGARRRAPRRRLARPRRGGEPPARLRQPEARPPRAVPARDRAHARRLEALSGGGGI